MVFAVLAIGGLLSVSLRSPGNGPKPTLRTIPLPPLEGNRPLAHAQNTKFTHDFVHGEGQETVRR
jgi:hypothetical protein